MIQLINKNDEIVYTINIDDEIELMLAAERMRKVEQSSYRIEVK